VDKLISYEIANNSAQSEKADYSYDPSMRMLGHSEILQGYSEADTLPLKKAWLFKIAYQSKRWIGACQALSNAKTV
jgi:hypothetical protein